MSAGGKVALVHEYFCNLGGADTVARVLHEMFPDAPVYTLLVYDRNRNHPWLEGMELRPSLLQRLPLAGRTHLPFVPFMPYATEHLDLSGYDIILSSSSFFAKGIVKPKGSRHFSYTHTRQRVARDLEAEYVSAVPRPLRPFARWNMGRLREWDVRAAQRVDEFIANSHFVAQRLGELYGRRATVIPPPVDTDTFAPTGDARDGTYLVVGRLVRYKRFDLAVEACRELGRKLVVIGEGPERAALEQLAGSETRFLGEQPHAVIREFMGRARGLLHPGLEDFGIVPVEAQAMGCPVIAYGAGGVCDTVRDGETGFLFAAQTAPALIEALERAERTKLDAPVLRANALRFSTAQFKTRLHQLLYDESLSA